MKIITWNCNMAFRKKAHTLLPYKPDIVVVQECEHPDNLKFTHDAATPTDMLWIGENRHKGLGIFSYSGYRFKLHKTHNPAFKHIAPVKVTNGAASLLLYAVWANNPADKDGPYVTQVWKALHHYDKLIRKKNTLLVGDFNSNTIWDRPRRAGNHSTVVQRLATKNIHSTYHQYFTQQQGKEAHPTYYLYRHEQKPYHLDYCFASADLLQNLRSVQVGDFATWRPYSDHVPVIVEFGEESAIDLFLHC